MPQTTPLGRRRDAYIRLFRTPGALAFTLGNLVARLPMGMFGVSAVFMIAGTRGSYALAGAVTATGLAATALVAPWTARLVDRYGQARIAVPATAVAAAGSLALLLCVRLGAPDWTLFAAYAATATTPNTGGMSRARWAHLHRDDPAVLHTANSFEQAVDELCFMLGPVVAALLCSALFPEAGTLVGAVLLMTGILLFTAQRATEPPAAPRTKGAKSPVRTRGFAPLLAVFLATGAVFGSLEVVTIAYADGLGHRSAAGGVLALQAAGSCAAGLLYGSARPASSASRRLVGCVAAMAALMCLPLLAARATGSLAALAAALLCAGAATAPTMVTGMTLVQRRTPEGQLNEGMTLAVTAILGGIAAGSALGGQVIEQAGAEMGYLVPVCAASLALLVSAAGHGRYAAPPRRWAGRPLRLSMTVCQERPIPMAMKKSTIQQQVAEAIAQANPQDRPLVTIQAIAGPSVWLMSMFGVIGQAFLTYYFITVTQQAVLLHRASRMSNRPQEIVVAIPPNEAMRMISDVRRNTLWSSFRCQLPGQPKPTRMNVHRMWRNEMDQLLGMLTGQPVA